MRKSFSLFLLAILISSQTFAEDLLPPVAPTTVNERMEKEIATRRKMLKIHQAMGLTTLTLLTATTVLGQLNYNDVINGSGEGTYQTPHKVMAITSTAFFVGTGMMSLLAPDPLEDKEKKTDVATFHKWTMILASAAIVTQIVLGIAARDARGTADEASLAKVHLGLGYATLGLSLAGASLWLF